MAMSDIVKVTEEEFDNEGNLVRRVITEYRANGGYYNPGGVISTLPNTSVVTDAAKYRLWNDAVHTFHLPDYDVGPVGLPGVLTRIVQAKW
jgi:hypothetical protein